MGNLPMELKPIVIKNMAEEAVAELRPMANAKNVVLDLKVEENLPPVLSDPEKCKMVFTNLIDNSVKYSKGKGRVDVSVYQAGDFIEVAIKDEGVGIPRAQQKNIFQKFFRSDNIMKHETVGTGLGLFIVKAIVDANKGQIWFKSEEDKGTTFYFKMPIAK
jgi:signal transduction histidine kinase